MAGVKGNTFRMSLPVSLSVPNPSVPTETVLMFCSAVRELDVPAAHTLWETHFRKSLFCQWESRWNLERDFVSIFLPFSGH